MPPTTPIVTSTAVSTNDTVSPSPTRLSVTVENRSLTVDCNTSASGTRPSACRYAHANAAAAVAASTAASVFGDWWAGIGTQRKKVCGRGGVTAGRKHCRHKALV